MQPDPMGRGQLIAHPATVPHCYLISTHLSPRTSLETFQSSATHRSILLYMTTIVTAWNQDFAQYFTCGS